MAKIRRKYVPDSDFSILRGGKMSVYKTVEKQMIYYSVQPDPRKETHSMHLYF